ncbi:MAG: ribonuclease Z [Lachnospiraceae bacterium]|nr:ribonuclease Z [Lachnospiraceae bacterium]
MLDVCLLGTGGMMPLHYRYLTSLLLRLNGSQLLIDCGEGTQMALRKSGFSANPIDVICLTHFHGDHVSGLPGLLLSMGNAERKERLRIIGPKGLTRVVHALRVVAPELPFEIEYLEFSGEGAAFSLNGFEIRAFRVDHNVPCYGYTVSVKRAGRFDAERAKKEGIPLKYWNRLQHGETIRDELMVYKPSMVMGPERKGLKVLYATDTRPTRSIVKHGADADLMILEGMYGDVERLPHVVERKHMLMQEACMLAKEAGAKELWLTHFSPAENRPKDYQQAVDALFSGTVIPKDGQQTTLQFEEDE